MHRILRIILYTLGGLLVFVSLCKLWDLNAATRETESLYQSLAQQVHAGTTTQRHQAPAAATSTTTATTVQAADDVEASVRQEPENPWLREMQQEYSDLKAWLTIPNTVIDYPVMQTTEDNDFYLTHDVQGGEDRHGTPFLDVHCDLEYSDNLIVYGHHMKDGTMFQNLMYYKDPDFCAQNGSIQLATPERTTSYAVFCVLVLSAEESEAFPYFSFPEFSGAPLFSAYLERCRAYAVWCSDVFPQYGDQLLTLSTCEYSKEDGRLVVLARKIS